MKMQIVDIAIENLINQTRIHAEFLDKGVLDGTLRVLINQKEYNLNIELKRELRSYHITSLKEIQERVGNLIVIAEQIFPKVKEQLRDLGIPYLESNGNFFYQTEDCFCLIDTNKKASIKKDKANRAFTKTGLKVVFHLLNNPGLINKKQRDIANAVGVALGNIPQVINGLKETGYLLSIRKGEYILEKKEELINRWIDHYATKLRPSLIVGKYSMKTNWQDIHLNDNKTVWGGEPAADILTQYLRPEKFLIYTKERKIDLIKEYKLIPKENGSLEVLEMFWENTINQVYAPPLLVYAELMITGGKRNLETAEIIYNDYIKPKL